MIVRNRDNGAILGEAIEVAWTAVQKAKGLLGRECLEDGQGLLFRPAASLHTFFMQFPIDIIYTDKDGKVLKLASAVRPFKLVAAPWRSHIALELPVGTIERSMTRTGHRLTVDGSADEAAFETEMRQSA
jgi:uncharacterized membrane protein (UPF0127 family)